MFAAITDLGTHTKHGYEKLAIIVHLMPLLDGKGNLAAHFARFKSYLVSLIKRGVTPKEEQQLAEGILKYVMSDPATNERIEAMDYLFGLEFLSE